MIEDAAAEEAMGRMIEYYKELEMLVAMLVAKYGFPTEGGMRLHIPSAEAFELRGIIGTPEPVVIKTFDMEADRYVLDVL